MLIECLFEKEAMNVFNNLKKDLYLEGLA